MNKTTKVKAAMMLAAVALFLAACGSDHREPCEESSDCGARRRCEVWTAHHGETVGPCGSDKCCIVPLYDAVIHARIHSAKIKLASEECTRFGQAVLPPLSAFLRIPKTGSIDGMNMRRRAKHMNALAAAVNVVSTQSAVLSTLRSDMTSQAKGYAKLADELYRAMELNPNEALVEHKLAELGKASNRFGKLVGVYSERCGPNGHFGTL